MAPGWQPRSSRRRRPTDADWLGRHEDKVLLVLTLVIGAVVSLVIVAFILITENLGARLYPAGEAWWRRLLVPTAGALLSGLLLSRYFKDARGSGIPQTKAALFLRDGFISFRTVVGKFVCSSVSLASGMALGREGPSVHLGAGIASSLGRRLGLGPAHVKTLVPVGTSAALAAAFNTPIAAVLFTLEEVMGNLHAPVLGSIVLSSATSWMVLHLLLGDEPLFHVPAYQLVHPLELIVYAVLGLVGGLVSVAFVRLLLWIRRRFLDLPSRTLWLQPAAGGALVGLLGVFAPAVLGVGYLHVGSALNGQLAIGTMAALLGLKLVATAACYGSGNAGGIFGPSLFLGAMMGGAVGGSAHWLLPDYTGGVGAYALVGMGAAFAGIIRVPMTSVIMIFEITRDYTIIVPLMVANLISYIVSMRLQPEPIYEALQLQEGIRLPPPREQHEQLLRVAHAMRPRETVLAADETVASARARILAGQRGSPVGVPRAGTPAGPPAVWLVVDGATPIGGVTVEDLDRAVSLGRAEAHLRAILDAATATPSDAPAGEYVHPDQPVDTALRRLARSRGGVLPVVAREDRAGLVGSVSVGDVLAAYADPAPSSGSEAAPGAASPRLLLAGVTAAVSLLLAFSGGLAVHLRGDRLAKGHLALRQGDVLLGQNRTREAIERYRLAVATLRSTDARRALGLALLETGNPDEAQIYLRAVVEDDAADGPANLGLARIAAARSAGSVAALGYERAMAGHWPDRSDEYRRDVAFEFADFLARAGNRTRAVAEVLRVASLSADDPATRARAAAALGELGAHREAANLWEAMARTDPGNLRALVGLGEARFALAEYRGAAAAFRRARRLDASNEGVAARLALCEDVLGLDPTARGLGTAERHRRSVVLLERTLRHVRECAAGTGAPAPDAAISDLAARADAALRRRVGPRSRADATEANIRLASDLWQARGGRCAAAARDDAIALVLDALQRDAGQAGD